MTRYQRIASAIRESILAGRYAPGEKLPGQRALADTWQTTLPTVRQALDQLQREGFLRVEHGLGTFVADLAQAHDPFAVASFVEALRERGLDAETRLLSINVEVPTNASTEAAAALGVTEREGLAVLTRVRLVSGIPLVHQRSYLAGRHRSKLRRYDGIVPLYAFLRDRLSLLAAAYRETVTAAAVPPEVAQVLGLAEGAPILVSRRTTATADGHPFLYDEAHLPPDRIQVAIARQGTRCTVNLAPMFPVSETAPLPPGVVLPLPS